MEYAAQLLGVVGQCKKQESAKTAKYEEDGSLHT
jgi:hypothetical protein